MADIFKTKPCANISYRDRDGTAMQDSRSINSSHGVTESINQLSTKQFFIFPSFCSISPSNKTFLGRFVFLQESKLELVKIPQPQETNRKGSFVAPCTDNLPIFYFRKAIISEGPMFQNSNKSTHFFYSSPPGRLTKIWVSNEMDP